MVGWHDDHQGEVMIGKTIEERIAELERIQAASMQLIKTAGGKLRSIPPDASKEQIVNILHEIGGNLLSVGRVIGRED